MSEGNPRSEPSVVIAVDVMGADLGVKEVLKGLDRSLQKNDQLSYLLFGRKAEIEKALKKRKPLRARAEIVDCPDVVSMDDRPSHVMRRGQATSMYGAVQAVKDGRAHAAVSCGNTGALMAVSMLLLRKAPRIKRPAIAVLWPSATETGINIMLDGGADIKADMDDLTNYAIMGAAYSRNAFGVERPRVGLLNVGTEDHKGHSDLHDANARIPEIAEENEFSYAGFIEGGDIMGPDVDVIVTDGFTGNVALKTAEGTARLLRTHMRAAFTHSILSKIGSMFAYTSLTRLRKNLDPRRFNGGVFLGLNGVVIKSHGSSDAVGLSSAVRLAFTLAERNFSERVHQRLSNFLSVEESAPKALDTEPDLNEG